MAETMNRNIQLTVVRVEAPAMLDDADALGPAMPDAREAIA